MLGPSLRCKKKMRVPPPPLCFQSSTFRKRGSSVVSALASGARGPRFDPRLQRGKFCSTNTLSLVSFAGMTLDKCIVLRIGTLTECPLCRESPLAQVKEPYGNLDMVTCRLSSCNPECTLYTCR